MTTNDIITSMYSGQMGNGLPFFAGNTQYQWGGGILETLGMFAFPILKRVLNIASNTLGDVIEGDKPLLGSLATNAMNELVDTGESYIKQKVAPPRKRTSINKLNDSLSGQRQRRRRYR